MGHAVATYGSLSMASRKHRKHRASILNTTAQHSISAAAAPSIDAQIRGFLAGETNGAALFHALYDDILDEPIPESMRAILRGAAS